MSALSSTSSSFGTAAASTRFENTSNGIDDAVRAQALAEEEAMMNQFKVRLSPNKDSPHSLTHSFPLQQSKVSSPGASGGGINPSTNPFLASPPTASAAPIVDLFDAPLHETRAMPSTSAKASDDLLQLGNPFADMFGSGPAAPAAATAQPHPMAGNQMWMGNGSNGGTL